MTDLSDDDHLAALLARLRAGDLGVRDELVTAISGRLERLAHNMLRGSFGRVGRWADTGDVFQGAAVRLWTSLAQVRPESVLHFHRLSAQHVRRELIDLARHYYGPQGLGARYETPAADRPDTPSPPVDPVAPTPTPDPPVDPAALHTAVAALPEEEAVVTDLLFYQGLNQEAAARNLGVDVRTVQRRWSRARRALGTLIDPDAV